MLGKLWKCYGNTMESHRAKSCRKRVEILWECFRSTVGAAWDTVDQNIIERSLESGGNIMGIPWKMLWEYYGNTTGILVYINTPTNISQIESKSYFNLNIFEKILDFDWIEPTIQQISKTLNSENPPESSKRCKYCNYYYNIKKFTNE